MVIFVLLNTELIVKQTFNISNSDTQNLSIYMFRKSVFKKFPTFVVPFPTASDFSPRLPGDR